MRTIPYRAECITENGVRQIVVNIGEQEKGRSKRPREEKGKVRGLEQIGPEKEVITMVVPAVSTGKRKYIKKDTEYWNSKKKKGKGSSREQQPSVPNISPSDRS